MIPAITSVCRPQNADPETARREHRRHAPCEPTSAENAWHFFLNMFGDVARCIETGVSR